MFRLQHHAQQSRKSETEYSNARLWCRLTTFYSDSDQSMLQGVDLPYITHVNGIFSEGILQMNIHKLEHISLADLKTVNVLK